MTDKIEITKYDKPKAKWYFALLKFLELFGLFLFVVGFQGLGNLVYKHLPKFYGNILVESSCVSYSCMWFVGFVSFIGICLGLVGVFMVLVLLYIIIEAWVKGNWCLAKRFAEDKDVKLKRLKEQELDEKKAQRKKFGYCVGDEAKYICKEKSASNRKRLGQKCKILKIDDDGDIYPEWEDGTKGGVNVRGETTIYSSSFKITKQKLEGGKK